MDTATIINILNYSLIGLFVLVILSLVFGFIRGLFRGWRYGTYRFGYFLLHVIVCFVLLDYVANWIGQIDISGFLGASGSLVIDGKTISYSVSSIRATGESIITQLIRNFSATTDPTKASELAFSLVDSLLKILTILAEGILLATVFELFCFLLWHIAFKRVMPLKKRKASYKKGRLVSAFSDFLIVAIVGSMILVPASSLINSLMHGFETTVKNSEEKEKIKANGQNYDLIVQAADTYNDSVFAKMLFNWNMNENGQSFDQVLIDWLTSVDYNETKISFAKEIQNVAEIATYAVESGILSENASSAHKMYLFMTSEFAPQLIMSVSKSALITNILPFAFDIATNIDEVSNYISNDLKIDYTTYDWTGTVQNLSGILDDLQHSGLLSGMSYSGDNDQIVVDGKGLLSIFSAEGQTKFESFFSRISNDNPKWKVFNDLIMLFALNSVINSTENESSIETRDFFPSVSDSYYRYDESKDKNIVTTIPDDYKSINFGFEIGCLYRSFARLNTVNPDFLGSLFDTLFSGSVDMKSLVSLIVDNVDEVGSMITGEKEDGTIERVSSTNDAVLDSSLIVNAMPKFFKIITNTLNESFSLEGDSKADSKQVNDKIFYDENGSLLSLEDRRYNSKLETKQILKVVKVFAKSETGKNLIKNYDTLPGLTFEKNGDLNYIESDIFGALKDSLYYVDDSILLSYVLPKAFAGALSNQGSLMDELGVVVPFDFSPEKDGKSVIGEELGKLLDMYSSCQGLINYIKGGSSSLSSGDKTSTNQFLSGLAPFLEGEEESQLYILLNGFSDSLILNPTSSSGEKNLNYISIFNTVLKKSLGEGYTYEGAVTSPSTENLALVKMFNSLISQNLLSLIGSDSIALSSLSGSDFRSILSPLQDTTMLKSVFVKFLDEKILNESILKGKSIEGVSFSNVTDWDKEGESLNTLVMFASTIGDFSNIDLANSDASAITGILVTLSQNEMFGDLNGYKFGNFVYQLLIDSVSEDMVTKYFSDRDDSSSTKQLKTDMTSLTNAEWKDEAKTFGDAITYLSEMGILKSTSGDSNIDFSKINTNILRSLLRGLADSRSIGRVIGYRLYRMVGEEFIKGGCYIGDNGADNLNADAIWDYYDDNSPLITDIYDEYELLADLIDVLTNPKYGMIGDDGKITFELDINNSSSTFMIEPALTVLADSVVFNTIPAKSDDDLSAFENILSKITYDSGIYGKDGDNETTIKDQIDDYVKSIRSGLKPSTATEFVQVKEAYEEEIACWSVLMDSMQSLGLSANFSLDNLFTKEDGTLRDDAYVVKANLDNMLYAINSSKILYNALPKKIDAAVSSFNGLAKPNSEVFKTCRSEEAEIEISNLTSVLLLVQKNSIGGSSIDFSTVDVGDLSNILYTMANSKIFNTKVSGEESTTFQDLMCQVFDKDGIKDYYYYSASPKDSANSEYYSSSKEKAKYNVSKLFPELTSKENIEITKDNSETIIIGDSCSLKTILTLLQDDTLSDAFTNNKYTSIPTSTLENFLLELNGNELMKDVVPNSIHSLFNGDSLALAGFDMKLANAFYMYNVGTTAPDFSQSYSESEINSLCSLISKLDPNGKIGGILNDISQAQIKGEEGIATITEIKETLGLLYESNIFHKAGADKNASTYKAGSNDLTIFEQTVYQIYHSSSLDNIAFNETYDFKYADASSKLYQYIKYGTLADNGEASKISVAKFSGFDWLNEINSLTISDTADDGLLYSALNQNILDNGVSFDESNFSISSATSESIVKVETLSLALNKCVIINDVVPYQVEELIGSKMQFSSFSSASVTYALSDGTTSFTLGDFASNNGSSLGMVTGVSIETDGNDEVDYKFTFEDIFEGTIEGTADSSNPLSSVDTKNAFAFELKAKEGTTLKSVTVNFDSGFYFVYDEESLKTVMVFAKDVLNALNGYPVFGDSATYGYLMKDGLIKSILTFIDNDSGYFNNSYSYDSAKSSFVISTENISFKARDIVLNNMLKMNFVGDAFDLSKYFARSDSTSFETVYNVFEGGIDYQKEENLLKKSLFTFATTDIILSSNSISSPISNYNIPTNLLKVEMLASQQGSGDGSGNTVDLVNSAKAISNSETSDIKFANKITEGMLISLYDLEKDYALLGTSEYFNQMGVKSLTLQKQAPSDGSERLKNAKKLLDSIDSEALIVSLAKDEYFSEVLSSVMNVSKNISVSSNSTALPSSDNASAAKEAFIKRDEIIANCSNSYMKTFAYTFYLGNEYSELVWNGYYYYQQLTSTTVDYPNATVSFATVASNIA